ncbi:MAG: argininosuccinate lyase [Dehalococcoidia bacterium]|nr:argininosuccinate lyase [Chloroflexota bacterium]MCK4242266.1 argininosuccinate lyase [Dehalococcoidia bacterium]
MNPLRNQFEKEGEKSVEEYTASIPFDRRLYKQDIVGSIAHAKMLAKQGIISDKEAELIMMGLASIREEIEQGVFELSAELEDIHMNIEARLIEKIGEAGQKLHTARSRNDQIALDMRLFAKEAISHTIEKLVGLQKALLDLAEANKDVVMPGYTHLQRAQPVLFAHHILAYFEMLQRDVGRFRDCLKRADVMPLGSGALAGVPYAIDREFLAQELGFARVSENSMDAVSDRDFIIEYQAAASLAMMHISRLAEEIILWSSVEFGFVRLAAAYTTGSSIMPQKRNPDVAELARGKTGRVYGNLLAILTTMKALPLTYNRDLQEDKEGFFDTVNTLISTLEVLTGMIATMQIRGDRTKEAAEGGYILATDLADYLVRKGVPFRQAHEIVGKLVQYAMEKGKGFKDLSLDEYQRFSPLFAQDVYSVTVESSLEARTARGGTAPRQVEQALKRARKIVQGEDA